MRSLAPFPVVASLSWILRTRWRARIRDVWKHGQQTVTMFSALLRSNTQLALVEAAASIRSTGSAIELVGGELDLRAHTKTNDVDFRQLNIA